MPITRKPRPAYLTRDQVAEMIAEAACAAERRAGAATSPESGAATWSRTL